MRKSKQKGLRSNEWAALIGMYLFTLFAIGSGFHIALAQSVTPMPITERPREAVKAVLSVPGPRQVSADPKNKGGEINASGQPTQVQKDATEIACAHAWETHETELVKVHISRGVYMTTCYTDLLAIAYTESRFNNEAVGDHGMSFGPFQIYTNVHKQVTKEQAEDFEWAASWTLERMMSNGYPVYRTWAIGSHNSYTPTVNARYAEMVKGTAEGIR